MLRTVRRVVLVLLLVAVVAGAAIAFSARPDLDAASDDAAATWQSVRGPLTTRYDLLGAAADAVLAAGGAEHDVVAEIDRALDRWREVASGASLSEQVEAANVLEGLARRLAASVAGSERLSADADVTEAMAGLDEASIPESARAFDDAVSEYEDVRGGPVKRTISDLLGYGAIPALDLGDQAGA